MELRQLRYFLAIAEHGSFSKAASTVYVAQSALSHQLAQLEEELGQSLFHRLPRGVEMTPAGRAFHPHALSILRQVEDARHSVSQAEGEIVGKVIFGQESVVERGLVALLAGGHALLVGVPGLAKTKLVETLGITLGLGGVAYAAGPAGFHHPRTPEEGQAHMDKMIDHMIEQVKGSEEQRAAIKAIVAQTAPQVEKLHAEGRDLKTEFHDLLQAEKIDRAALEAARKDAIDLADRGSKILVNGVAEAAEALTPAQRKALAEAVARFHR